MKELLESLNALISEFTKDATQQADNGNKAAGTRARKASLAIEKQMKQFRKLSVDQSKK